MFLIKVDKDSNPIKDSNGLSIICSPGEKGLLVGITGKKIANQYSGYANDKSGTSKKIIENLFKKGQTAFNTGKNFVFISIFSNYNY